MFVWFPPQNNLNRALEQRGVVNVNRCVFVRILNTHTHTQSESLRCRLVAWGVEGGGGGRYNKATQKTDDMVELPETNRQVMECA